MCGQILLRCHLIKGKISTLKALLQDIGRLLAILGVVFRWSALFQGSLKGLWMALMDHQMWHLLLIWCISRAACSLNHLLGLIHLFLECLFLLILDSFHSALENLLTQMYLWLVQGAARAWIYQSCSSCIWTFGLPWWVSGRHTCHFLLLHEHVLELALRRRVFSWHCGVLTGRFRFWISEIGCALWDPILRSLRPILLGSLRVWQGGTLFDFLFQILDLMACRWWSFLTWISQRSRLVELSFEGWNAIGRIFRIRFSFCRNLIHIF